MFPGCKDGGRIMNQHKLSLYLQLPCGVWIDDDQLVVIFESDTTGWKILWFDGDILVDEIAFTKEECYGNRYVKLIDREHYAGYSYIFMNEKGRTPDSHATKYQIDNAYGVRRSINEYKALINDSSFDWEEDTAPRLEYKDVIAYLIHVRGFTVHISSDTKHPGTFEAVCEKISYLKELGVNTIELQPAYEFQEYLFAECNDGLPSSEKMNYWGYKEGYYFAPKCSYSATNDPAAAFKTMVKALHKHGIEIVMQFYFPKTVKRSDICYVLRYWVTEYHVDGFHLKGAELPIREIAENTLLKDVKIWYEYPDAALAHSSKCTLRNGVWAEYKDSFLFTLRRFLNNQPDSMQDFLFQMRFLPAFYGKINYITNYYGMTLHDMVTYNEKCNVPNGEENRDGMDDCATWNCGYEGEDAPEDVRCLRLMQMKNAVLMLMLSQGVPLLFMGDEIGNTQFGNNNPYCHDDLTTWLNWSRMEEYKELYSFIKCVIQYRKENAIFHLGRNLCDTAYGEAFCPELSYIYEETTDGKPRDNVVGIHYFFESKAYLVVMNMCPVNKVLPLLTYRCKEKTDLRSDWRTVICTGSAPSIRPDGKSVLLMPHTITVLERNYDIT